MIKFGMRILFIGLGILLILDAFLPKTIEHVAIDRHHIYTSRDSSNSKFETKNYTLEFNRGSIGSCNVGYSVYSRLNDGDEVEVSATKFTKRCARITHAGQTLQSDGWVWTLSPLVGLAIILSSLGIFGLDRRVSITL